MKFYELRKLTNLNQQEFAKLIHVPVNTYRKWEATDKNYTSQSRARYPEYMAFLAEAYIRQQLSDGIILSTVLKIIDDGTNSITIKDEQSEYCCKYQDGLDNLVEESWYRQIQNRVVKKMKTIGGKSADIETVITLA